MRCRSLLVLSMVVLTAAVSSAGPLDWSYTATFLPSGGKPGILLGHETLFGPVSDTPFFIVLRPGSPGWPTPVSGVVSGGDRQIPFTFSSGNWEALEAQPTGVTDGGFDLTIKFTDAGGHTATVTTGGGIAASGVFTSGTGNFTIGLTGSEDVTLGERKARVTFSNLESESANRVTFQVDELSPSETPEPGTLIIGGIALAGGMGAWFRRRK